MNYRRLGRSGLKVSELSFGSWVTYGLGSENQNLPGFIVLAPGSPIYVTEVMNSSFLLHPYSPNTWRYWMAFNDFQYDSGGDPFIGAKLGNLLLAGGYRDVVTEIKTVHFDNREPARRKDMIAFWEELLLSAADSMVDAGRVPQDVVDGMRNEMRDVQNDPDAVFFYAFVQARATVY